MDCLTTLELLDCVRPNTGDLELPEFADARAHLEQCAACRDEFERRQQFDVEISRVSNSVPVPAALRMSLLAALSDSVAEFAAATPEASAAAEVSAAAPSVGTKATAGQIEGASPRGLRRLRTAVSLAACLLIAAVSVWLWQPGPAQLSLAAIQSELNLNLPQVTFDDSFAVSLPPSWASNPGLRVSETLSGLDLDDRSGHDAAAAYFAFSSGRAAPIRGVLVAIPVTRLRDVPTETVFSRAAPRYPQTGIVAVAWQEQDLVYLCFVAGDTSLLERVQRGLTSSAA